MPKGSNSKSNLIYQNIRTTCAHCSRTFTHRNKEYPDMMRLHMKVAHKEIYKRKNVIPHNRVITITEGASNGNNPTPIMREDTKTNDKRHSKLRTGPP